MLAVLTTLTRVLAAEVWEEEEGHCSQLGVLRVWLEQCLGQAGTLRQLQFEAVCWVFRQQANSAEGIASLGCAGNIPLRLDHIPLGEATTGDPAKRRTRRTTIW
jgi:hypothetical protein